MLIYFDPLGALHAASIPSPSLRAAGRFYFRETTGVMTCTLLRLEREEGYASCLKGGHIAE